MGCKGIHGKSIEMARHMELVQEAWRDRCGRKDADREVKGDGSDDTRAYRVIPSFANGGMDDGI